MAAPETNSSVILATARAEALNCLDAYRAELERTTDKAVAAGLTATIRPLEQAATLLGQAIAASVGYSVLAPATPGTKAK